MTKPIHPDIEALAKDLAGQKLTDAELDDALEGLIRTPVPPMTSVPASLVDGPHRKGRTLVDLANWDPDLEPPADPSPAAPESGAPVGAEAKRAPTPLNRDDPLDASFDTVALRPRQDGWTAQRQRAFIAALAETGCVSEACAEVGLTPRSAYRLREHPAATGFRDAWTHALSMATARLVSHAFERAIHGSVERIYRDGVLIEERRKPSEKLLMWLVTHLDPVGFGWASKPPGTASDGWFFVLDHARRQMPGLVEGLADIEPEICPVQRLAGRDYEPNDESAPDA